MTTKHLHALLTSHIEGDEEPGDMALRSRASSCTAISNL